MSSTRGCLFSVLFVFVQWFPEYSSASCPMIQKQLAPQDRGMACYRVGYSDIWKITSYSVGVVPYRMQQMS